MWTNSSQGDLQIISVFTPSVLIRLPEVSARPVQRYPNVIQRRCTGIRFQLQIWQEIEQDGRELEHVRYTPLDLDKEPAQFREKLEFLGSSFAFERHQIQVFFEQLKEHVGNAVEAEADVIEVLSDG